jgi:chloramphenicol O-acetyltransferase
MVSEKKKTTVTVSVEVNHRTVDGYHLGRFYERLQENFNDTDKIFG